MQQTLDTGRVGIQFIILSVENDVVASKLIAMGIRVGATLSVLRRTFLSGAICIKCEGIVIALRKNEASFILVEPQSIT